jgi:hypothetical protein
VRRRSLVLFAGAALAAAACGTPKDLPTAPDGGTPDPTATLSRLQAEIFSPTCALAGCHASAAPQLGLDLAPGRTYSNVVSVRSAQAGNLNRIEPFNPDSSYLVWKIRGDPGITDSRMPQGGTLSAEEIQLIVDWVRRGAPND